MLLHKGLLGLGSRSGSSLLLYFSFLLDSLFILLFDLHSGLWRLGLNRSRNRLLEHAELKVAEVSRMVMMVPVMMAVTESVALDSTTGREQ